MIAEIYKKIKGLTITTDTRKIKTDDVFIALKGENFDGNTFAAKALESGAKYVVVDNKDVVQNDSYILVDNTLLFLQQLAAYHRQQLHIPIIGITGTNGKTTTKELTNAVLSSAYRCVATQGNFNNHIGVPLTLLSMDENTQIGIVEMGANHPGEIEELCKIADPDFALITNVGKAHLEGFGSFKNIVHTKCALYNHVIAKGGTIFVFNENALLRELAAEGRQIVYGATKADIKGDMVQQIPYLVVSYHTPKGDLYIKTHLVGGYNFMNVMAAIAIGNYFKVPDLAIKEAIEKYMPTNMRSQLKQTAANLLIIDAYNANPSSMNVAITNFSDMVLQHKIAILGEMRELGASSRKEHQQVIDQALNAQFEQILLVGDSFNQCNIENDNMLHFKNVAHLKEYILNHPIHDCSILIKGSRGNQLEQIIDLL